MGVGRNYWSSVLTVLSGSATAQVVPLLGALLIARLFSPTEYGQFSIWLGVVAISSIVITGRYEMALAIEPDGEPRRIAMHGTLFVVMFGGLLLTVIALLSGALGLVPNIPSVMLWTLGPAAVGTAASQVLQSCAAADGNYRDLGLIRIVQALAITLAQVLAGLLEASAGGLSLAHLGGVGLGGLFGLWRLRIVHGWSGVTDSPSSMLAFLSRRRKFPMFALPADSINTAAAQLPLIIVAHRFGADIAGLLALTLRMVGAPIGLLGASVLDVFRRTSAASYAERGECCSEYVGTFKVLAFGSCIVAIALANAAEFGFSVAFGETWRMSGTIAVWLMPMFALRFVASPLSYMFYVAGKQHQDLIWQLILLIMTIMSLWIPRNFELSIQIYGVGYSILYCIYIFLTYKLSKGLK